MIEFNQRYILLGLYAIIQMCLCSLSCYFVWGKFVQFTSEDSSFKRSMGEITKYPTIIACFPNNGNLTYREDFTISKFKTYEEYASKKLDDLNELALGPNSHPEVTLTEIYGAFQGKCFQLKSTTKSNDIQIGKFQVITVDFKKDELATDVVLYLSSKNNAFGVLMSYWTDGDARVIRLGKNTYMEYGIGEEEFQYKEDLNVKCNELDQSFYDCFIPELMKSDFAECPKKCLPFDPNVDINRNVPMCKPSTEEFTCARTYAFNQLQNIRKNGFCTRSCKINEYRGHPTFESKSDTPTLAYYFLVPSNLFQQKEYIIYDFIGFVTAVGGSLGLFIGFSFKGNTISNFDTCTNIANRLIIMGKLSSGVFSSVFEYLDSSMRTRNKVASNNVIQVRPVN